MLGGPSSSASNLTEIYTSNNAAITQALTRIASGKRVQNASDDYAAFADASNLESHSSQYAVIKQKLAEAKGFFDYAAQVGNTIITDLNRLYELKGLYDNAVTAGDAVAQASDKAEYDAIIVQINNTISNANYEAYPVYQAAALYKSVTVNLDGGSFQLTPTAVAATGTINDITAVGVLAAIQTQQTNAVTYSAQVQAAGEALTSYSNLADTVIASNEATISVLTGIDDVWELAWLTSLQVRQQATVAMMAQANVIQGYAAALYNGRQ